MAAEIEYNNIDGNKELKKIKDDLLESGFILQILPGAYFLKVLVMILVIFKRIIENMMEQ